MKETPKKAGGFPSPTTHRGSNDKRIARALEMDTKMDAKMDAKMDTANEKKKNDLLSNLVL